MFIHKPRPHPIIKPLNFRDGRVWPVCVGVPESYVYKGVSLYGGDAGGLADHDCVEGSEDIVVPVVAAPMAG